MSGGMVMKGASRVKATSASEVDADAREHAVRVDLARRRPDVADVEQSLVLVAVDQRQPWYCRRRVREAHLQQDRRYRLLFVLLARVGHRHVAEAVRQMELLPGLA